MGFFSFFESSSSKDSTPVLPPPSRLLSAGVPHDVSFHLTTLRPSYVPLPTGPPPRPVPLPLEVVLSIIEHAYLPPDGIPDTAVLRSCALVSKRWSLPAQKLLFSNVSLHSAAASNAFRDSISRSPVLAEAVVRLRAIVDRNQPSGLDDADLAGAIALCPNLYELSLSLYGSTLTPAFGEPILALLRSGPRVSALEFNNWTDNTHVAAQLLSIWTSLTSLSLGGTPPAPPSSPQHYPSSLHSLRLNHQSHPNPEFLTYLLHSSSSLHTLEFTREPPIKLLSALLSSHAASLRSLTMPSCHTPDHANALAACLGLREVCISGAGSGSGGGGGGASAGGVSTRVWRSVTRGVEHVAIGVDVNTGLQPLVDRVRARNGEERAEGEGEGLKCITVHFLDGGERNPLWGVLRMVCAYEGVDVRVVRGVGAFRELVRGDPIPTLVYPRTRSLQNIYRMRSLATTTSTY